jgi:DNA-binding HxlR family transcriptional regulator
MSAVKTKSETDPVCRHFLWAAGIVGQRWVPQIIRALEAGSTRFVEIRGGIPQISDHLLSQRLKAMEADGIVERRVTPSTPVRIEYRLSKSGGELAQVMAELGAWAERWADAG